MVEVVKWKYNVIKSNIRDIKTSIILGDYNIELNSFTNRGGGLLHRKKFKMIQSLIGLGAILTGSSALELYKINGVSLIGREPNDLDFILSKDNFIKFCGIWDLHKIKSSNNVVTINLNTGKYRGTDGYGYDRGYWFGCNFDIIGLDDEIHYTKKDDISIMNLDSIIGSKFNLMNESLNSDLFSRENKHLSDLWTIVTRLSKNQI